MSSRICTYRSYLSESSKCPTRYFWKNSKGHSALLTITDASLSVADYALTCYSQSNEHVLHAADTMRELKLIHSFTQVPKSFFFHKMKCQTLIGICEFKKKRENLVFKIFRKMEETKFY